MAHPKDYTGQVIGHLTVLERHPQYRNNRTYYKCVCECGTVCYKSADYLRNNPKASCGCKSRDYTRIGHRKNFVGQKK